MNLFLRLKITKQLISTFSYIIKISNYLIMNISKANSAIYQSDVNISIISCNGQVEIIRRKSNGLKSVIQCTKRYNKFMHEFQIYCYNYLLYKAVWALIMITLVALKC